MDSAGTNNGGTFFRGAGFAPGEVGLAFDFRSTNFQGYLVVPDSPSLNLGSNNFTIELWANFAALWGERVLICKDDGDGQGTDWEFWLNNGVLQFTPDGIAQLGTGVFNPELNTWHHLAVTRASTVFSFYVDGSVISTDSFSGPTALDTGPLTIGALGGEGHLFMGGLMDEIAIYNRALSTGEIQAIYNAGSAGKCTTAQVSLALYPGVPQALYPGVSIAGLSGHIYGIQYTTNLTNTNSWVGLTNLTLSGSSEIWYDSVPAAQPQHFYRVLPGPIPIP